MSKKEETEEMSKGAIVGRALAVSMAVFFFAATLFIVLVIVIVRLATKHS